VDRLILLNWNALKMPGRCRVFGTLSENWILKI
jgi:hypothetical protein